MNLMMKEIKKIITYNDGTQKTEISEEISNVNLLA